MALLIKKFGGTSVGDITKIKKIAQSIVQSKETGNDIVVVVSAMGNSTCLLYTSPSPRDLSTSRMPSSA